MKPSQSTPLMIMLATLLHRVVQSLNGLIEVKISLLLFQEPQRDSVSLEKRREGGSATL